LAASNAAVDSSSKLERCVSSRRLHAPRWRSGRRPIILQLGDAMLKYTAGDRVAHSHYGDGTINSVNEYHTVIDFDAHGVRTFSSPRVVLSASSTPPPVRPVKTARRAKRPSVKAS
jgi:hypothetical protein